jgi:hypothetical protein
MKKITILLAAVLISFSAFSQKRTRSFMGWHLAKDEPAKLNEVKLNLGTSIFALYPEFSYERIISEDFGLGASAGVGLDPDSYMMNFAFTPYARWYFGGNANNLQKYGAGFFIEANGALLSQNTKKIDHTIFDGYNSVSSTTENAFGAGFGLAVGWKYLSRNNWVGDIYWGVGRDFVNSNTYPRLGISIGKRF